MVCCLRTLVGPEYSAATEDRIAGGWGWGWVMPWLWINWREDWRTWNGWKSHTYTGTRYTTPITPSRPYMYTYTIHRVMRWKNRNSCDAGKWNPPKRRLAVCVRYRAPTAMANETTSSLACIAAAPVPFWWVGGVTAFGSFLCPGSRVYRTAKAWHDATTMVSWVLLAHHARLWWYCVFLLTSR
jgi:hypothetical protein